jgi:exodeoxyribonuclease VIII
MITMPSAEYHRRPEVNKSLLDLIEAAPAKAKARLDGAPSEPTPAMLLGTAVHAAVLEPWALIKSPEFNKRSKEGKAEAEAFAQEHTGKVIVDPDTFAIVQGMREGVMRHPVARRIFDDGLPEQSCFAELLGVPVRCRPDWYRPSAGLLTDLKSVTEGTPDGFSKSVAKWNYHLQHAFYMDVCRAAGFDIRSFVFVVVETKPPFCAAVYVLDDEAVEIGRDTYRRLLDIYKRCVETNDWPGYPDTIQKISLPGYFTRRAYA